MSTEDVTKHRERGRRYYAENREAILAKQRAYYAENADVIRERHRAYRDADPERAREATRRSMQRPGAQEAAAVRIREWQKANPQKLRKAGREWRLNNPEKSLVGAAKQRAKTLGLPFNISHEDIFIPEFCPVLPWIKLEMTTGKASASSPSLDRMVPELGYVRGNVRVISNRANTLKRDGTSRELELVTAYVRAIEDMGGSDG